MVMATGAGCPLSRCARRLAGGLIFRKPGAEAMQHATGAADSAPDRGRCMAKVIALILLLAMLIQIIKPLGIPGFRKRSDFWKVAVVAIAAMMLTVLVRP